MELSNHDKAINKAEQEVARIKQSAENIVKEFKQVTQAFLTGFANYIVNRSVTEKPDVVTSLESGKRNELKKAIAEIVATFPDESNKRIENIAWAHRTAIEGNLESNYGIPRSLHKKTMDLVDGEIRQLIGKIGSLLIKYGLANADGEWQSKGGSVQYAYGLPDHEGIPSGAELRSLKFKYSTIMEELVKATKELQKAEQNKKVSEAKSLWESD